MITYQGKKYPSYVEVFLAMCNEDIPLRPNVFPHSKYFYIKAHLKEKFNKEYSVNTIRNIIVEEFGKHVST